MTQESGIMQESGDRDSLSQAQPGVQEEIVMTPLRSKQGKTLRIERVRAGELCLGKVHYMAAGPYQGIIINKAANVRPCKIEPGAVRRFTAHIQSSDTTSVKEIRELRFWFKSDEECDTEEQTNSFFRQLLNPTDFPKDYLAFVKTVLTLVRRYASIKFIELEIRPFSEADATVDLRGNSVAPTPKRALVRRVYSTLERGKQRAPSVDQIYEEGATLRKRGGPGGESSKKKKSHKRTVSDLMLNGENLPPTVFISAPANENEAGIKTHAELRRLVDPTRASTISTDPNSPASYPADFITSQVSNATDGVTSPSGELSDVFYSSTSPLAGSMSESAGKVPKKSTKAKKSGSRSNSTEPSLSPHPNSTTLSKSPQIKETVKVGGAKLVFQTPPNASESSGPAVVPRAPLAKLESAIDDDFIPENQPQTSALYNVELNTGGGKVKKKKSKKSLTSVSASNDDVKDFDEKEAKQSNNDDYTDANVKFDSDNIIKNGRSVVTQNDEAIELDQPISSNQKQTKTKSKKRDSSSKRSSSDLQPESVNLSVSKTLTFSTSSKDDVKDTVLAVEAAPVAPLLENKGTRSRTKTRTIPSVSSPIEGESLALNGITIVNRASTDFEPQNKVVEKNADSTRAGEETLNSKVKLRKKVSNCETNVIGGKLVTDIDADYCPTNVQEEKCKTRKKKERKSILQPGDGSISASNLRASLTKSNVEPDDSSVRSFSDENKLNNNALTMSKNNLMFVSSSDDKEFDNRSTARSLTDGVGTTGKKKVKISKKKISKTLPRSENNDIGSQHSTITTDLVNVNLPNTLESQLFDGDDNVQRLSQTQSDEVFTLNAESCRNSVFKASNSRTSDSSNPVDSNRNSVAQLESQQSEDASKVRNKKRKTANKQKKNGVTFASSSSREFPSTPNDNQPHSSQPDVDLDRGFDEKSLIEALKNPIESPNVPSHNISSKENVRVDRSDRAKTHFNDGRVRESLGGMQTSSRLTGDIQVTESKYDANGSGLNTESSNSEESSDELESLEISSNEYEGNTEGNSNDVGKFSSEASRDAGKLPGDASRDAGNFLDEATLDLSMGNLDEMNPLLSDQPSVTIITSRSFEKSAVDAMLDSLPTSIVLRNNEGLERLYTLGSVENIRVVSVCVRGKKGEHSSELVKGCIKDLLDTFRHIDHVVFVGVGGALERTPTGDYEKIRLGDVVMSHCDSAHQMAPAYVQVIKKKRERRLSDVVTPSGGGVKLESWRPEDSELTRAVATLQRGGRKSLRGIDGHLIQGLMAMKDRGIDVHRFSRPRSEAGGDTSCDDGNSTDSRQMSPVNFLVSRKMSPPRSAQYRRSHLPVIHYAAVGTGKSLYTDIGLRTELAVKHRVRAIDSGFGLALEAIEEAGRASYVFIRGIAYRLQGIDESPRAQGPWAHYAALTAAAAMKSLLLKMPSQHRSAS